MTLDEAKKVIHQHFKPEPLAIKEVPLLEAYNRVLAQDVIATLNIPPFNRSTVDGYAVKAEDTFGADENKPVKLKVCGTVNVGEPPTITVKRGTAAEIVTGAPIPEGANAVVMVEYTERKNNDVYVYSAVGENENVMKAGSDISKGETVLKSGQLLGSREIGVLAALGMAKIKVYAMPKVAIFSTGAEVTEPGKKLPSGKIYDINGYALSAAVLENGGEPVFLGVFPDYKSELQAALRQALAFADLIITSGGVSVGPKDVMPQVLNEMGKVVICGIAVKPGKPTTVASINGKMVFSLPGHPTSSLLLFHLLVRPVLRLMAGRGVEKPLLVEAFVSARMFPAKGRRTFVMVKLKSDKKANCLLAEPVSEGLSGAITTLAKADGFVEIAENQQFIEAGEKVTVHLFRSL